MTTIEDIERLGCENGENRGPAAFPESYRIMQDPWELAQFIAFVRSHTATSQSRDIENLYFEIGLGRGGLFRLMRELDLFDWYLGIDNDHRAFRADRLRNLAAIESMGRTTIFLGDSHSEEGESFINWYGGYGVYFIDGDHSYEGVKQDLQVVKSVASAGSLIALHDSIYYGPDGGVAKVVREIEAGEVPGLKVAAKFERVYGIVVCEVM